MKIFIAGGGTGGHIYPAIAIAEALKKIDTSLQIEFVGSHLGLESKIIPKFGYKLNYILTGQLNFEGHFFKKIKTLIKIPIGVFQSIFLILKNQPDFVLGVGGYVSVPFMLAAVLLRRKTGLWEPNAHPGMANRLLSRFSDKSYLVFDDAKQYLHSKVNLVFGMPLRSEMENLKNKPMKSDLFCILCFGGSQGSQFLNEQISDFIISSPELHGKIQVIHQTGPKDFERIKAKYEAQNIKCVQVFDFIFNMPDYYQIANVLFCRGGASTLAEAAAFGVVPLVVPLPAADNHQQKNAESLVAKKSGFMFLQKSFQAAEFKSKIIFLMQNTQLLNEMSENLRSLAPQNASGQIAEDIIKEINI